MTTALAAEMRVQVDPTNPGQFFACCGLLELADRLWEGAEGWFENGAFALRRTRHPAMPGSALAELLRAVAAADLQQVDPDDDYSSPIHVSRPFDLRLDWWVDESAGGARLKVWAGSMCGARIARAMQRALVLPGFHEEDLLNQGMVVFDPLKPEKKVEPFYFDARRGANAQALDVGFAPDSLEMTTTAYPAVEFLCLVGLQRCRPLPTERPRVFDYHTWSLPIDARVASAAVCGQLPQGNSRRFRFENAFRTDQKKHKAFTPATPLARS